MQIDIINSKKNCHKKYKGKIRKIIDKQIEKFYEIEKSNFKLNKHAYKIGDDVILNKTHFLHGISKNDNAVDFIAENGILSKEATGDLGNHAFQFVAGFWKVEEKILLKDYILNYSGIDVRYGDTSHLVAYGKLDKFVEDMKAIDHWKWEAISSMEIRFMPSLARDINQYGFILNIESNEAQELVSFDINSEKFNYRIKEKFSSLFKRKNRVKLSDNTFLQRAAYIVYGLNKCFIEGVLVGKRVENDKKLIKKLKEKFPEAYVCNLQGKVIAD